MSEGNRWLEGIVVLDLTRYLTGPACTRLLCELGADVIKIEQPPYGDPNRSNRPRFNRRAGAHIQQNRGKRSVCIDITSDGGAEVVRELVPHVDVVVENSSPGVLQRRGLEYRRLREIKPDLIMASVSGLGQTGPLSQRPCFDLIAQAYAGLMHMTGETEGPPMFVGIGVADTNAGVHAFAAIGHALFHRERTGTGTHLDIAMVDSLFHMHEQSIHGASMDPENFVPIRQGRDYPNLAPAGSFRGPTRLDRAPVHRMADAKFVERDRPSRPCRGRSIRHEPEPAHEPSSVDRHHRVVDGDVRDRRRSHVGT